ncbi:BolA-like protein 3 [Strongyloides ratti]|uniref:BolA-like protein 3 n=1 Tax=Strongyloides ratti TaxID=34506 RepID=A0A090LJW1_STRRB|nr:BolA-like protein 3 [Strongyloides ratti]CEF68423.1 BolA-like protein 3 [Strongyloides ratti]
MFRHLSFSLRKLSSQVVTNMEEAVNKVLKESFPKAVKITTEDVSGGCGQHFKIYVESEEFKGKSRIQQHKLVTGALKDYISQWHAVTIDTKAI